MRMTRGMPWPGILNAKPSHGTLVARRCCYAARLANAQRDGDASIGRGGREYRRAVVASSRDRQR